MVFDYILLHFQYSLIALLGNLCHILASSLIFFIKINNFFFFLWKVKYFYPKIKFYVALSQGKNYEQKEQTLNSIICNKLSFLCVLSGRDCSICAKNLEIPSKKIIRARGFRREKFLVFLKFLFSPFLENSLIFM